MEYDTSILRAYILMLLFVILFWVGLVYAVYHSYDIPAIQDEADTAISQHRN